MDNYRMRHKTIIAVWLLGMLLTLALPPQNVTAGQIVIETIATDLRNPRGVAVMPHGRLLVVEAGDGTGDRENGGHIRIFSDLNGDGKYDDPAGYGMVLCCVAGYNALTQFGTGQDEVGGLGDLVLLDDGRVFFTQDDPREGYVADGRPRGIAILGLTPAPEWRRYEVVVRNATMNALAYDPDNELLYVAESGLNRVSALTLDGQITPVADFSLLAHDQQSVPAGLARDPRTGELLVALFSGQIREYYGTVIAYMPEAALIARLDPRTGEWREEITGLTTAVDVDVDEDGNLYVVEMATGWPAAPMPRDYPLYDPDAPPDAGGYPRFSGRVTMYPADGGAPLRLAEGLDQPTNITYHDGALYVSAGQGTPGRPIMGPGGRTRITGEIYRITGFRP
jgi:hypothetical protein